MIPIVAQLLAGGISILGNAIAAKGKEYVEEKLGVEIPDGSKPLTPAELAACREIQFKHEEALQQFAIRKAEIELESEKVAQGAVTERWKADMLSDSPLSKNIRPLVLLYLLATYTIMSLLSAVDVNVNAEYVKLLGQMLMLAFSAYFVGRTWEKTVDMRERGKIE
jgi:hypothetical protein